MAIMTTKNVALDTVTRAIGVLIEDANKTLGQSLEYLKYGFQDIFPDSEDEQLNSWWSPARGSLTVEGQTYFSGQRYRDLIRKWVGLFKSFLIYGETPVVDNALQGSFA